MIWVRLSGGLGNQLFQWAAAEEIKTKIHQPIVFYAGDLKRYTVPRNFLLSSIKYHFHSAGTPCWWIRFILRYRINKIFPTLFPWYIHKNNISKLKHGNNRVLDDYFQNTLLINNGIKAVVAEIVKLAGENIKINRLFNKMLAGITGKEAVALHIRRKDYLSKANRKIFCFTGYAYYARALARLGNGIKKIFIFSDDTVEEITTWGDRDIIYINSLGLSDVEEFILLSKFDHIIITNSTYSFWAALIANAKAFNGLKIGPSDWLLDERGNETWNKNLLSEGFILV